LLSLNRNFGKNFRKLCNNGFGRLSYLCRRIQELKNKNDMKIAKFMMAIAALMMSTACSGNTGSPRQTGAGLAPGAKEEAQAQDVKKDGKALVVFFSHAGDNYSVGNIKVGNTKIVADYITEMTGADQFEIVTHKYDGMAYKPLCDLAKEEQKKGELPPFEGEPGDLSQYDTVFIGGPVWWGTYPQVMFTFFKK